MQDAELEELRRRKMMEIQRQQEQQALMQEQAKKMEAEKAAVMRQILSPEARERLATVRMAYPEVAQAVEEQLIRLAQMGRIDAPIDDNTLRQILRKVSPKKRDINIERK